MVIENLPSVILGVIQSQIFNDHFSIAKSEIFTHYFANTTYPKK